MKIIIAIALVLVSVSGFAVEKSLTKSLKPGRIIVAKDGSAMAQFSVLSRDFSAPGLLVAKKTLTSVEWRTTHYPDNLNEEVEICYTEPGRIDHVLCEDISPNASGTTDKFNNFKFDMHARVTIRHSVKGGRNSGAPAGMDSVVINYSY
ncbi:hypothetical protein EGJ27_06930 [Pseudomonas sp. v388]|uniref:hypothetical protein n=1 Tax=Pseudomonas sp. v388 TaxID=2479849 RepID=UPI000F78DE8C|nr:hypothetical protein [Pseudomonas sp. v388]RRV09492.1 hypothetical protein EGJ27_06930 [Pseudomonas sp. v388]